MLDAKQDAKDICTKSEIFQSFWHGGELSPLAWVSISSFVRRGYVFKLYTFDDITVPTGVDRCPAGAIVEKKFVFFLNNSYSYFADLFRYHLLNRIGRWWVDADVILINNAPIPTRSIVFAEETPGIINNAVLKFPIGHFVIGSILDEADRLDLKKLAHGESGPKMITKHVRKFDLYSECVPSTLIYPLNWIDAYKLVLPEYHDEIQQKINCALFLHAWNSIFQHWGFSTTNERPLHGSYLDRLYNEFGVYSRFDLKRPDEKQLRASIDSLRTETQWIEYTRRRQTKNSCG